MHAESQLESAEVSWLIPVLIAFASTHSKGLSLLIPIRKPEGLRSEILTKVILIEIDKQDLMARFTLPETKRLCQNWQ